jgi:hypothetical protein
MTTGPLVAISTEIGRGHPSYLDSVLQALREDHGVDVPVLTLDQVCAGRSRKAWDLAFRLYRAGAKGGPVTWLYNRTRSEDSRPASWQLSLLGTDIGRRMSGFNGVCVVEHPLVAHILARVCRVAYLHAEIAAPAVGVVPDAWRTLVPLETTRRRLMELGAEPAAVTITGLVVEPELVRLAESAYRARLGRLSRDDSPLTVGFFTSGAYPKPHLDRIVAGAVSCLDAGHNVAVFAGTDRDKARKLQDRLPAAQPGLKVMLSDDRRSETTLTAEIFPELDAMVAAAHERTNWAVGLGLPMCVLLPNIGPFAPQNFRFARDQGVCLPVGTTRNARTLGPHIEELRQAGELRSMAERGYGPLPIGGAAVAATALLAGSA